MTEGPLFTIAIAGLAALTIGGVLYALFYPTISGSAAADKRLNKLTKDQAGERVKARGEKSNKDRRKSVSDTLKEVEQREKARTKSNPADPPLQQSLIRRSQRQTQTSLEAEANLHHTARPSGRELATGLRR